MKQLMEELQKKGFQTLIAFGKESMYPFLCVHEPIKLLLGPILKRFEEIAR